jgi:hypothetical protein
MNPFNKPFKSIYMWETFPVPEKMSFNPFVSLRRENLKMKPYERGKRRQKCLPAKIEIN